MHLHVHYIAARGGEDIAEASGCLNDSQDLAQGGIPVASESSEAEIVQTAPEGANGLVPVCVQDDSIQIEVRVCNGNGWGGFELPSS